METQMKSLLITRNGYKLINVFAYSSNSLPGLEIHIPKFPTQNMKEKFIFMTKVRRLDLPIKRFVLCAEVMGAEKMQADYEWLELSLLLLYWQLAGVIPLMNLEDCFTVGKVSSLGEITHLHLPDHVYKYLGQKFNQEGKRSFSLIHDQYNLDLENINLLPTEELFSHIPNIKLNPPDRKMLSR